MNTVKGCQRPRIEHRPAPGIKNHANEVAVAAQLCGLLLDEWQEYALQLATQRRSDGQWSAYEVGLEVARQNGKSAIIEARIIWGLFFNKAEKTIVYSAHEFKTAVEIFNRLVGLISSNPRLMRLIAPNGIKQGNNGRGIKLKDGSEVKFLARSGGSARGFSGDLIIFDEAYALKSEQLAAMRPTMAARSITGQPQLWFASSAGMPDSDVLNGMRGRIIDDPQQEPREHTVYQHEHEPKLLWMEWSAHHEMDSADLEARRLANPSLGVRISLEFLDDELRGFLGDPEKGEEAYRREYLGIRPVAAKAAALSLAHFKSLHDPNAEMSDVVALAVDVTPSRDYAVISAAALCPDGRILIEVVDHNVGTDWVTDALKQLKANLNPVRIIINAGDGAAALAPEFKRAGIRVTEISMKQYVQACGQFLDDYKARRLVTRVEQEVLLDAVKIATMRFFGDTLFRWNRKNPLENIAPLVAVTLAVRGLEYKRNRQAREEGIGGVKKKPRRLAIGH
ncbi:terminase large subunit domain-containing protein [Nesterenkonia rhizosphaerae]|uniref:Terminase large subunit-like ATPase domain-containing protein n=1 Tax=Nesterenkonia rhizosphaerae TaxID=1348272 RepID=A0ABP9G628_9MICC